MNRDEGKDLSPLWLNAIKNSKHGQRRGREETDGRGHRPLQDRRPHPPPPNIGRPTPTLRTRPHPPSTPPPNIRRPTPTLRTRRTSHATATTTQAGAPPSPGDSDYLRTEFCTLCIVHVFFALTKIAILRSKLVGSYRLRSCESIT